MNSIHSTRRSAVPLVLACVAVALALASCSPAPSPLTPREFEAQWHNLLAQRDYRAAEKLIALRDKQLPDDPEALIARANLLFRQATGPGAGFAANGRRGAATGDSVRLDTLLAERALDTLREGIKRHPERLDIRMGLSFLCQQLGLGVAQVQVIEEAIAYARGHGDALLWSYGEPLPLPADQYLPRTLHENVRYYAERGGPGDDQMMMAIAQRVMQAYPNNAYVPNDVAFWYATHNEWERSLEYLQRAERADSTDGLVLYNLGWANEHLKRPGPAAIYYRRALLVGSAAGKEDIVSSSRQRLADLGVTP